MEWGASRSLYEAKIVIEANDRVGLLKDIATLLSSEKVNISSIRIAHTKNGKVVEDLTVLTSGATQLSRLLSRIEGVFGVITVERAR